MFASTATSARRLPCATRTIRGRGSWGVERAMCIRTMIPAGLTRTTCRKSCGGRPTTGCRGQAKRRKRMATEKTASATWEGDLIHGSGHVRTGTGSVDADMNWAARAEEVEGASPEELIAAAHATCVSMALSAALARAGTPPRRLESEARTTFEEVGDGFGFTAVRLTVQGEVDGLDDEAFRKAAEDAKENCPVSQALKGNVEVSLDASLASRSPSRSA